MLNGKHSKLVKHNHSVARLYLLMSEFFCSILHSFMKYVIFIKNGEWGSVLNNEWICHYQ